jgi:hypothetical protein
MTTHGGRDLKYIRQWPCHQFQAMIQFPEYKRLADSPINKSPVLVGSAAWSFRISAMPRASFVYLAGRANADQQGMTARMIQT